MKIAYFSPLSPERSGIADYSEELLPYLAQYAEIDLFVDGYRPTNLDLISHFAVYSYERFEEIRRQRKYDVALYQMGNSPYHAYIYQTLCRYPGITVLHEYMLQHLIVSMTVARGDDQGYIDEMGYSHGKDGLAAARDALQHGHSFPYDRYAVNRRVLDSSLGVIVHSDFAKSKVLPDAIDTPIGVIPPHISLELEALNQSGARESLALEPNLTIFGAFGFATPAKRLSVALKAFQTVHREYPATAFLIVGERLQSYDIEAQVAELGVDAAVRLTGYVDKPTLLAYIRAVDVGVNLRWPTLGESSASLLRLMAAGKPTIVSNEGAFAEVPDACCVKIATDLGEADSLVEAMCYLAGDRATREDQGARARHYILAHHRPDQTAAAYVKFIQQIG